MIRFSILVPVYNVECYLRECLDSIVGQTYQNLEVICIDDGSTDGSGKILDEYAQMDNRITVFHKENKGYGHTMNMGLQVASGDYIGIVESDDYIAPDMFEKAAVIIEGAKHKVDIVKFSYANLNKSEVKWRKLFKEEDCNRLISPMDNIELFRLPCSIWSAVYNKDMLMRSNINFMETPGASYQDMSFTFKVFCRANNIILSNECVYFYRTYNVDSSINSGMKVFCVCDEMREIDSYLARNQISSALVANAKYIFMCQSYWWNYSRIYGSMRYVFYLRMVEAFKAMVEDARFDYRYLTEQNQSRIQEIMADPDGYFVKENPYYKKYYENDMLDQYTSKNMLYEGALKKYLSNQQKLVIYGAGVYGKLVLDYLRRSGGIENVIGIAVTDKTNNPERLENLPIYEIQELYDRNSEITVIVAVKAIKQLAILRGLKKMGFRRVIRVDDTFMNLIYGSE